MTSKINIAAIQFKWKLEDYKTMESFQQRIDEIMESIRKKTGDKLPLFVAFPEDIGTPMLMFEAYDRIKYNKTFKETVQKLIMSNLPCVMKYKLRYGVSFIRALLLSKGIQMEKNYVSIFCHAASKYNAYIVAGSITLPDIALKNGKHCISGKDVYNLSCFFGPDRSIIGRQKKVHLVDFEEKSGFDLSYGSLDELKVFETSFGRVGIAICLDAFKEDVCAKLSSLGADILVQPSANNGEWSKWQQEDWLNGSFLSTNGRKKFKYAINPMMNGNIFDLGFEGQSSIISCENTQPLMNYSLLEPRRGFLAVARSRSDEEILIKTVEI